MYIPDVFLQIALMAKAFATRIAFVVSISMSES